jgi:hypothetical protein
VTQASRWTTWRTVALLAAMVAGVGACGDDDSGDDGNGGGGGVTGLTVSAATPASGNGTLTNLVVTVDENSAVAQGPAIYVTITGSVGTTLHSIEAYILKSDQSFPNIEHKWGSDLATPEGFTICDAGGIVGTVCSASQATAGTSTITFEGLVLTAAMDDGDLSTIDGEVSW